MKTVMVSLAVVASLGLPVCAEIVSDGHVLTLYANVSNDTIPGVRTWAATAAPFASLAVPVLDTGYTGPMGRRTVIQTTPSVGGKSFKVTDALALQGCATTLPPGGYHCEIIARVSAK